MREEYPVVRPQELRVPREALELITRSLAERYRICPVGISDPQNGTRILAIATSDPANIMLLDQLQQMTKCRIRPVKASEEDITRGIELHYGNGTTRQERPSPSPQAAPPPQPSTADESLPAGAFGDVSTSAAVESIIQRAITDRASDVHIEPHATAVVVRFRIDGIMYDYQTYELLQHPQVISRIKILSKTMDIAEKRIAQDGRFDLGFGDRAYDVRVSILPSNYGEKAVMRMLPKGPMAMDFDKLGIIGRNRELLEEVATRPFGMTLITGPTGSGKTTTLYACLAKIDCISKNVVTVEDPIEYQFSRITQVQVHPKIGMTFANNLRAILRQDPDVIMVGEIRDLDTLQIAMQAALTGHTVYSTIHCNDSAAAAARMVDMGAEAFLITSSVNAIISQRLVRLICEHCKVEDAVTPAMRLKLGIENDKTIFYTGKGCSHCRNSGYSGRIGVFEVIPLIEPIQEAIVKSPNATIIRSVIRAHDLPSLMVDAMDKARRGWISLEEVTRAVLVDAI